MLMIVAVSLSGATPMVIDSPTTNCVASATGTSFEPSDAPGAATVDAPEAPVVGATGMTVQ